MERVTVMREMFRLFIMVLIFSAFSGGVLAALQNATRDRIETQQLTFVKGPTILEIMAGAKNDPLMDRFKVSYNNKDVDIFVGDLDGNRNVVALEGFGKGYGGDMGVMVAINVETDKIVGVGVTTHSETPGLGSRAKTDLSFAAQFKGQPIQDPFKVRADGGNIDALSGATISSRGVCGGVLQSGQIYDAVKQEILSKLKAP